MLKIFLIILALVIIVIGFYSIRFYRLVLVSRNIVARTVPYSLSGSTWTTLLVIGDSTAVWVGATTPDESIAGLLTKYIGATRVENHGVSWAVVADVHEQVKKIREKEYDYVLLQIWGNDMTRFHDLDTVVEDYEALIASLPKSKTLIVMSCGNLGDSRIFPRAMWYIYESISRSYKARFAEIVTKHGGIYVDLFDEHPVDPFYLSPDTYFAPDYFHPSSIGYAYWFTKVQARLEENIK